MNNTVIFSNTQYPRYEVSITIDGIPSSKEFNNKKMEQRDEDAVIDSSSVDNQEDKKRECEVCVVCGDRATKYRYSHYGKKKRTFLLDNKTFNP